MRTEQYHIDGMSCAACSSAVERVTRKLGGVEDSNVNLTTNRMVITYDEDQVTSGMICEAVSKAGYGASLLEEEQDRKKEEEEWQQQEEHLQSARNRVSRLSVFPFRCSTFPWDICFHLPCRCHPFWIWTGIR